MTQNRTCFQLWNSASVAYIRTEAAYWDRNEISKSDGCRIKCLLLNESPQLAKAPSGLGAVCMLKIKRLQSKSLNVSSCQGKRLYLTTRAPWYSALWLVNNSSVVLGEHTWNTTTLWLGTHRNNKRMEWRESETLNRHSAGPGGRGERWAFF